MGGHSGASMKDIKSRSGTSGGAFDVMPMLGLTMLAGGSLYSGIEFGCVGLICNGSVRSVVANLC